MKKRFHEFRDPIHVFIRVDSTERRVIDSRPLQRLRHINQLAMTDFVYPGATHKRFEHSLGVMELATRVFDMITATANVRHDSVRDILPEEADVDHWRRTLRMAALCHDIGHLPFSHAGEGMLPDGWSHERLTAEMIRGDELAPLLHDLYVDPEDVAKLAVGQEKYRTSTGDSVEFDDWRNILSEIITGDAFGVDRIDYLLRDSHHTGVSYGEFDHYRLIDTMRLLPKEEEGSEEPALGVESGGIHCAEALLLARYFMFTQLYFHSVRRIYDIHLMDFLKKWLKDGRFSASIADHLRLTDVEVNAAIRVADTDEKHPAHAEARRLARREHYRLVYQVPPKHPDPGAAARAVHDALCKELGPDSVRLDSPKPKGSPVDFPVECMGGEIRSCLGESLVLQTIPPVSVNYVFVNPENRQKANDWVREHKDKILAELRK